MVGSAQAHARVMVLDSNSSRARKLSHRLRFLNYHPVVADDPDKCNDLNADSCIAVMLGGMLEDDLRETFQRMMQYRPVLPVVLLDSDAGHSDLTPDLARHPAWTLDTPVRRSQLQKLLRRAERYEGKERRQRITGNSPPIRYVHQLIEQVADFDTSVLITGESGTGKELAARTIHELSERAEQSFVPINCGAIPADLLESELFGHEKGAFTGAVSARVGRFELAEGGTLFLDEIGDMSLPMQVKLLRVLQERSFERVGSNETRKCNVRIIAATHKNLPVSIEKGNFREDLYYRLNVFPIEMPPLHKRASDLPQLLDELLIQHRGENVGALRVSMEALQALARYTWPGNIRELSNLVERLAILHPSGEIGLDDLPEKYRTGDVACALTTENAGAAITVGEFASQGVELKSSNLKLHLQSLEQELIQEAMNETDNVVAKAARLLRMRRTTLVEKLSKYQLSH